MTKNQEDKIIELMKTALENKIEYAKLKGEFRGLLIGILFWDVPSDLKIKLEQKIKELE